MGMEVLLQEQFQLVINNVLMIFFISLEHSSTTLDILVTLELLKAANKYISSGAIVHITEEVDYTRAIYAYAKELCIKAIRNDLEAGFFSKITPISNGSITVDSSAPECANVVSALTTNRILDNVLSSGTAYSGAITNPDPLIEEQDAAKYDSHYLISS